MMTAPLSGDLRRRLLRAVDAGSSAREAARLFEVSASAAIKLVRRVREMGSAAPAKIGGYLRELTTARPGITLAELTKRGIEVGSLTTIWSSCAGWGCGTKKVAEGYRAGPAGCRRRP